MAFGRTTAEQSGLGPGFAVASPLFGAVASPLAAITGDGRIADVNPALAELVGRRVHTLAGPPEHSLLHPADEARFVSALAHASSAPHRGTLGAFRLVAADGRLRFCLAELLSAEATEGGHRLVQFHDETEVHGLRAATRQLEERFDSVVSAAPLGVFLTDSGGRLTYVNARWEELHERRSVEVLGGPWFVSVHPREAERMAQLWAQAAVLEHIGTEYLLATTPPRWIRLRLAAVYVDGILSGYSGIVEDVTVAHESTQQLTNLALQDPLTGLANRVRLFSELDAAMTRSRADTSSDRVAVLLLDLDGFKSVNDTFGHAAGDALLQHVAEGLRSVLGEGDAAGRLGGDEFAVVLRRVSGPAAAAAVGRAVLDALSSPLVLPYGARLQASASVGIALVDDATVDGAGLLDRADAAMYRAKRLGPMSVAVHDPLFDEPAGDQVRL